MFDQFQGKNQPIQNSVLELDLGGNRAEIKVGVEESVLQFNKAKIDYIIIIFLQCHCQMLRFTDGK